MTGGNGSTAAVWTAGPEDDWAPANGADGSSTLWMDLAVELKLTA